MADSAVLYCFRRAAAAPDSAALHPGYLLVLSLAFAAYAATHYPEAKTFRQAVGMAAGK